MPETTKDIQYNYMFEESYERKKLGRVATARWNRDPETLLFSLSRYKFVSRVLRGRMRVLEIGCGDGWSSRIVAKSVNSLILTDYDRKFVDEARGEYIDGISQIDNNIECKVHDFVTDSYPEKQDGIFALDVLEHIDVADEDAFLRNITESLEVGGICIFGTPTKVSQTLISEARRDPGHINCKDEVSMRASLEKYFGGVHIHTMTDEIVHTGSSDMAYYVFGIGVKVG